MLLALKVLAAMRFRGCSELAGDMFRGLDPGKWTRRESGSPLPVVTTSTRAFH